MKKLIRVLLLFIIAFVFIGCGSDVVIKVKTEMSTEVTIGENVDFTKYFVITEDDENIPVTESMLNLSNLDLTKEGRYVITVTYAGTSEDLVITVVKKVEENVLQKIVINNAKDLTVGDTLQLTVTKTPAGATEEVVFTSSNPSVVSCTSTGLIEAKSAGEAVISCKAGNIVTTATIRVTSNVVVSPFDNLIDSSKWNFTIEYVLDRGDTEEPYSDKYVYLGESFANSYVGQNGEVKTDYYMKEGDQATFYFLFEGTNKYIAFDGESPITKAYLEYALVLNFENIKSFEFEEVDGKLVAKNPQDVRESLFGVTEGRTCTSLSFEIKDGLVYKMYSVSKEIDPETKEEVIYDGVYTFSNYGESTIDIEDVKANAEIASLNDFTVTNTPETIKVGETYGLRLEIDSRYYIPREITVTSSNTEVLTADEDTGELLGISEGKATVTITVDGMSKEFTVVVTKEIDYEAAFDKIADVDNWNLVLEYKEVAEGSEDYIEKYVYYNGSRLCQSTGRDGNTYQDYIINENGVDYLYYDNGDGTYTSFDSSNPIFDRYLSTSLVMDPTGLKDFEYEVVDGKLFAKNPQAVNDSLLGVYDDGTCVAISFEIVDGLLYQITCVTSFIDPDTNAEEIYTETYTFTNYDENVLDLDPLKAKVVNLEDFEVENMPETLKVGESVELIISYNPENYVLKVGTIDSLNEDIVDVNNRTGVLEAISAGEAKIKITLDGITKEFTIVVTENIDYKAAFEKIANFDDWNLELNYLGTMEGEVFEQKYVYYNGSFLNQYVGNNGTLYSDYIVNENGNYYYYYHNNNGTYSVFDSTTEMYQSYRDYVLSFDTSKLNEYEYEIKDGKLYAKDPQAVNDGVLGVLVGGTCTEMSFELKDDLLYQIVCKTSLTYPGTDKEVTCIEVYTFTNYDTNVLDLDALKAKVVVLESFEVTNAPEALKIGETVSLTFEVNPANYEAKEVKFTSSNTEVLTVTEKGVIEAVGKGMATVTVVIDGVSQEFTVVVSHSIEYEDAFNKLATYEDWNLELNCTAVIEATGYEYSEKYVYYNGSFLNVYTDYGQEFSEYIINENGIDYYYYQNFDNTYTVFPSGSEVFNEYLDRINIMCMDFSKLNTYEYLEVDGKLVAKDPVLVNREVLFEYPEGTCIEISFEIVDGLISEVVRKINFFNEETGEIDLCVETYKFSNYDTNVLDLEALKAKVVNLDDFEILNIEETLEVGEVIDIYIKTEPLGYIIKNVVMTSSDTEIVKTNRGRTIEGIAPGEATITVEIDGVTKEYHITVVESVEEEIDYTAAFEKVSVYENWNFKFDYTCVVRNQVTYSREFTYYGNGSFLNYFEYKGKYYSDFIVNEDGNYWYYYENADGSYTPYDSDTYKYDLYMNYTIIRIDLTELANFEFDVVDGKLVAKDPEAVISSVKGPYPGYEYISATITLQDGLIYEITLVSSVFNPEANRTIVYTESLKFTDYDVNTFDFETLKTNLSILESYEITNAPETLEVGEVVELTYNLNPENYEIKSLRLISSDPKVVMTYDSGVIQALSPGVATITVINDELIQEFTVTVYEAIEYEDAFNKIANFNDWNFELNRVVVVEAENYVFDEKYFYYNGSFLNVYDAEGVTYSDYVISENGKAYYYYQNDDGTYTTFPSGSDMFNDYLSSLVPMNFSKLNTYEYKVVDGKLVAKDPVLVDKQTFGEYINGTCTEITFEIVNGLLYQIVRTITFPGEQEGEEVVYVETYTFTNYDTNVLDLDALKAKVVNLDSFEVMNTPEALKVGEAINLFIRTEPLGYEIKNKLITSSDTNVVKVNEDGTIEGVAVGEAVITINIDGIIEEVNIVVTDSSDEINYAAAFEKIAVFEDWNFKMEYSVIIENQKDYGYDFVYYGNGSFLTRWEYYSNGVSRFYDDYIVNEDGNSYYYFQNGSGSYTPFDSNSNRYQEFAKMFMNMSFADLANFEYDIVNGKLVAKDPEALISSAMSAYPGYEYISATITVVDGFVTEMYFTTSALDSTTNEVVVYTEYLKFSNYGENELDLESIKSNLSILESFEMIDAPETLEVGETAWLACKLNPEDYRVKDETIVSSNPEVVRFNDDGSIEALSPGVATITVTLDGVSKEFTITVTGETIEYTAAFDKIADFNDCNFEMKYTLSSEELDYEYVDLYTYYNGHLLNSYEFDNGVKFDDYIISENGEYYYYSQNEDGTYTVYDSSSDEYLNFLDNIVLFGFSKLNTYEYLVVDGKLVAKDPVKVCDEVLGSVIGGTCLLMSFEIVDGLLYEITCDFKITDGTTGEEVMYHETYTFTNYDKNVLDLDALKAKVDSGSESTESTSVFTDKNLSVLSGIEYSADKTAHGFDENRGVQFVQANGNVLITSKQNLTGVKTVTLVVATNQPAGMNVKVKVGDTYLTCDGLTEVTVNKTNFDVCVTLVFTSTEALDGALTVELIANASKNSMYISSISIGNGGTITVEKMEKQEYDPATLEDDRLQDYMLEYLGEIGLPSTGEYNCLVVPIKFTDTTISLSDLEKLNIAFNGTSEETGWESVKSFYEKTSYGKLSLSFDILEVFNAANNRSYYANYSEYVNWNDGSSSYLYGDEVLLLEVLAYLEPLMDLSIYDNNNDGVIDGVYLIYSGDIEYGEEDPFYWAYMTWEPEPKSLDTKFDGLDTNFFLFAGLNFVYEDVPGGFEYTGIIDTLKVNAMTFIHETGHLLGLDDYYDYDLDSGCNEGVGGADMMDYTMGDHSSYSKIMLDWIDPVIVNESKTITINAFDESGDTIMLLLDYNDTYMCEYILIDLYKKDGLNSLAGELGVFYEGASYGVRMYHVNSLITDPYASDYPAFTDYNNTDTEYALLKLIQADGETDFHDNRELTEASDLWMTGDVFSSIYSSYTRCDGKEVNFDITFDSVTETSATITITFME